MTRLQRISTTIALIAVLGAAGLITVPEAAAWGYGPPGYGYGPGYGPVYGYGPYGPGYGRGPYGPGPGYGRGYRGYGPPAAAFGPPPWAYGPGGPGGPGFQQGVPDSGNLFSEMDIAKMKQGLGVTPQQEPAWNALMEALRNLKPGENLTESPVVKKAYNDLLAVLSPPQRQKAEAFRESLIW